MKKGDTLYSIALDYGQDYRELAAWNNLEDPGLIKSINACGCSRRQRRRTGAAAGRAAAEIPPAPPVCRSRPNRKRASCLIRNRRWRN